MKRLITKKILKTAKFCGNSMHDPFSIVFFGTGPVAAESLRLLAESFTIEAVITKPRPSHHRGRFPVLDTAQELDLPIHTVTDKKTTSAIVQNCSFGSTVGVLIDFGIIVSQDVIDSFEKGIVNSHFSLLPEWRGADPITFSILSGQKTTGVSQLIPDEAMDEGPLLSQAMLNIRTDDTTPSLTEKLILLSAQELKTTLPAYIRGAVLPRSQIETAAPINQPTYSRKLSKNDGRIDWEKSAVEIERSIRAYSGWPQSRTVLGNIEVIITKAHVESAIVSEAKPGTILVSDNDSLSVISSNGILCIDELKPIGKNNMNIKSFLAGYRNKLGTII